MTIEDLWVYVDPNSTAVAEDLGVKQRLAAYASRIFASIEFASVEADRNFLRWLIHSMDEIACVFTIFIGVFS